MAAVKHGPAGAPGPRHDRSRLLARRCRAPGSPAGGDRRRWRPSTPKARPFASLVTVATTPAGDPILLLSTLARHTRNLAADRARLAASGGARRRGRRSARRRAADADRHGRPARQPTRCSAAASSPATRRRPAMPISPISASTASPSKAATWSPASAASSALAPADILMPMSAAPAS